MSRDGFWSGMFFGVLVGVAFTLMISNKIAADVVEAEKEQDKKEGEQKGFLDTVLSLYHKEGQTSKADNQGKGENDKNQEKGAEATSQSDGGQPEEEKPEKDNFFAKLDINNKINELEEALKELREEKGK